MWGAADCDCDGVMVDSVGTNSVSGLLEPANKSKRNAALSRWRRGGPGGGGEVDLEVEGRWVLDP